MKCATPTVTRRSRGSSSTSARRSGTTDGWSRSTGRAAASSRRNAASSRRTRASPRPRSTRPPRSPRAGGRRRPRARCSRSRPHSRRSCRSTKSRRSSSRAVPDVIDCDRSAVFLVDPETNVAHVAAHLGYPPEFDAELRVDPSSGPHAARTPTRRLRSRCGPRRRRCATLATSVGSAGATAVPIIGNGELIGWLVGLGRRTRRSGSSRTSTSCPRLRGLAALAATAVGNARLIDQIRHQALHDALTGLPNRALILDRVEQMSRARRRATSTRRACCSSTSTASRRSTTRSATPPATSCCVRSRLASKPCSVAARPIGRLGGDEFVVLVEGDSNGPAPELVAERLLDVLREPFELGRHRGRGAPPASASRSVTAARPANCCATPTSRCTRRRRRARTATSCSRPRCTRPSLDPSAARARPARRARSRRVLPRVPADLLDCETRAVTGVEALLRWRHPIAGVVQPDFFIPLLEETGLIVDVGRWVLRTACAQAAIWRDARLRARHLGERVRHASSTTTRSSATCATRSQRQRHRPAFADPRDHRDASLMRDAERHRGPPRRAQGARRARRDRRLRHRLLVARVPAPVPGRRAEDRPLVHRRHRRVARDRGARAHARAARQDARLETLAEGIEEYEQFSHLRREHCDSGQGFLFARPLDVAAVEPFLAAPDSWAGEVAS